jgi:hypothetical protein
MATWSKKTYEMVAQTIGLRVSDWEDQPGSGAAIHVLSVVADDLADEFERDNRAFDRSLFLRNIFGEKAFTILETVLVISVMMILVALAVPTFQNLAEEVQEVSAIQVVDAGSEALRLDFAKQMMETGSYTSPFPRRQREGRRLRRRNVRALEALLQEGFSYPPGFQWMLESQATTTSPPVVGYRIR